MPAQRDLSVEELRRESERSRAELTSTVVELREKVSDTADELKTRLSPAHIKEEVKEYVRDGSDQFFKSIERKARENPLQAVAIGAGLVYPLWGILKTIPVPIMLIGAGLWLSRQKSGAENGSGSGFADRVSELGAEGTAHLADSVRGAGAAVAAGAETVKDKVRAATHDIRDSVVEKGQAAMRTVRESAASATDTVSATAADFTNRAAELGKESRTAFVDLVDRNPLLVAGVGLAIGAFIAASLPPSEAENRMFGEHSDDLKDKALEAASHGVQRAKDLATGVGGDVAAAAAREGLDAEGIGKAVHGLTAGVKSVVDRGLKTALGAEETSSQSRSAFQPNKS